MPMPEEANAGLPEATTEARTIWQLFQRYLTGLEARTGSRFGRQLGEARFGALWRRLSEADRVRLRQAFADGFEARADASWPKSAAILEVLRTGEQVDQVAEAVRRALGR
jgi:hypothetical protein